jgi:hypothetical protein
MVNFTNDDILLYINNELSAAKATAFENALTHDWSLREKFEILANTQHTIKRQEALLSPSKRSVNNILNYAQESINEKIEIPT